MLTGVLINAYCMHVYAFTFRPVSLLGCLLLDQKVLKMRSISSTLEQRLPTPATSLTEGQVIKLILRNKQ